MSEENGGEKIVPADLNERLSHGKEANGSTLTDKQKARIERNRQRALLLRQARYQINRSSVVGRVFLLR